MESQHHGKSYTKKRFMTVRVKTRDAVCRKVFYSIEESHVLWVSAVLEKIKPILVLYAMTGLSPADKGL